MVVKTLKWNITIVYFYMCSTFIYQWKIEYMQSFNKLEKFNKCNIFIQTLQTTNTHYLFPLDVFHLKYAVTCGPKKSAALPPPPPNPFFLIRLYTNMVVDVFLGFVYVCKYLGCRMKMCTFFMHFSAKNLQKNILKVIKTVSGCVNIWWIWIIQLTTIETIANHLS